VLIWRELFVFKNTGRCFPKCISLIFKSFSALLSYWKQAWLKNNSTEQIPFIVYNFNSLEMCRKCSYWVHANGLGQNDAQYVKSTFCNRVSFFFFTTAFGNCCEKRTLRRLFSRSASTVPCQYPSTDAPCSLIHHQCYEILIIHGFLQYHRQKIIVSNVSFYEKDQSSTIIVLA
jgi:hypothetical protein